LRELEIARASPFARRGAVFRTAWLDRHFRTQAWYRPTGFDRRLLPKPELERVERIAHFQRKLSRAELERRDAALSERQRRRVARCALAVSASAERVLVQETTALRLWETAAGTQRLVPTTAASSPSWSSSIAISPDGARLFSVEQIGHFPRVSSWDAKTLAALPAFEVSTVTGSYLVPSDSYALTGDGAFSLVQSFSAKTWTLSSVADQRPLVLLPVAGVHTGATRVTVSKDRRRILALTSGEAWLWHAPPGTPGAKPRAKAGKRTLFSATDADLSPDGRFVATVGSYEGTTLVRADAPQVKKALSSSLTRGTSFVSFSPDGTKLLSGNAEFGLAVWEIPSGRILYEQKERAAALGCARQWAAFLPDGNVLALLGESGGFELFDLQSQMRRVVATENKVEGEEEDQLERALLARAQGRRESDPLLRQLTFAEQPLLLEGLLKEPEILAWHHEGRDLRALEVLIEARRGRRFRSPRWRSYAEALPFYAADPGYTQQRLTPTDRANLSLVGAIKQRFDPRPPWPRPHPASERPVSAFPGCPTGAVLVTRTDAAVTTLRCVIRRAGVEVSHGPEWTFLPTGRLRQSRSFLNGAMHGPTYSFYFTGALKETGSFDRGKRNGRWLSYHASGAAREEAEYADDMLFGARRRWFDNGKVALDSSYQRGLPEGPWRTFYDNGQLAVALSFRAGIPELLPGTPSGFSPEGKPWPPGSPHSPSPTASRLSQLDMESLPPVNAPPCSLSTYARNGLARSAWGPILTGVKSAFLPDRGGGAIIGPSQCVDRVALSCAPDLDGVTGDEVLAEVSYHVPMGGRGCHQHRSEAWDMRVVVALSPPTATRKTFEPRGIVGYPVCNSDVCPGHDTPTGFVRLPSGENAIRMAIVSGAGDCGHTERDEIRTLHGSEWVSVAEKTTRTCDTSAEPEENDVY
jgi:hypothetical protein